MADETTTTTQTDPGATQTTQTTPSTTTTTAGAGQTGGTGGEKMLTQAEVDAVVKDRLERQQRAIDAKAKSDREAAEAQRLTEQQEFKTLAERHEAKVREIEPQLQAATTERDALRTHVNRQIDTAMKDWPAEIKGLVPAADTADAQARLTAFETARAIADKFGSGAGAGSRTPGSALSPRPAGGQGGDPSKETETFIRSRTASF
jgi:hypothetical protein